MSQVNRKIMLAVFTAVLCTSVGATPNVNAPSVFAGDNLGKVKNNAQGTPTPSAASSSISSSGKVQAPVVLNPVPPVLNVHGYVLEEVSSGKVLASQSPDQRMAPASLTKLMTLYLTFEALQAGRVHMTDMVPISENAWKTGGSRMFVKVGDRVPLNELIDGVIVDSGNDACMALAEYIGGTEASFVNLMNAQAALMGMKNTHYMDCTGLPNPEHYTTPHDMTILSRDIILNFPQYYPLFAQKTFTYNKITQPNRNRLLWRDAAVDGLKTGHTDEAGYCLIASAKHGGMRLLSVVLGAPTDETRAQYTENLLNYGFRFYETHKVYKQNQIIEQVPVYLGKTNRLPIGVAHDFYLTTIIGQYPTVDIEMQMQSPLEAPIKQGQKIGMLTAKLKGVVINSADLVALESVSKGSILTRTWDYIKLAVSKKSG